MTAKSDAERARAYRDRKRGRATSLAPCGTRAAAARHRRRGEPLDERCKQAERDYQNQRNQAAGISAHTPVSKVAEMVHASEAVHVSPTARTLRIVDPTTNITPTLDRVPSM